jgi:hypothetical protein
VLPLTHRAKLGLWHCARTGRLWKACSRPCLSAHVGGRESHLASCLLTDVAWPGGRAC